VFDAHGTKIDNSVCERPVASSSKTIFWVSMQRFSLSGEFKSSFFSLQREKVMTYILAMNTLASRLKWARTEKKLTQDQLGELSDTSGSTIGNMEAGLRMSSRKIANIAAVLDVDALWLSSGKGTYDAHKQHLHAVPTGSVELVYLNSQEMSIITAYRQSDTGGRQLIESAITLAKQMKLPNMNKS
jgi:transcriptional regulator with XRE-family HTH domain